MSRDEAEYERRLDAVLACAPAAVVSRRLEQRVLAAAPGPKVAGWGATSRLWVARMGLAAGLAAACAAAVVAGFAAAPRPAPTLEGSGDAALASAVLAADPQDG